MLHTGLIAPVSELLERHRKERPDKVAYWDAVRSVTYSQLAGRTASIAAGLSANGVREGDRIAIYLPNGVDWIEACLAGLRAGAVIVPISYDAAEAEIAYRLSDADCRTVITTPAREELIGKLIAGSAGSGVAGVGRRRRQGSRPVPRRTFPRQSSAALRDPADIDRSSFIIYTSGTTGRAKGVLLSIRGMLWIAAACWAPICNLSDKDVVLSPLPLFHSYAPQSVGAQRAGRRSQRAHPGALLAAAGCWSCCSPESIRCFRACRRCFTICCSVRRKPASTGLGATRLGGTRLCISAGAIMPAALNRSFEERFGTTLLDGYGITETSTMVTMNWTSGESSDGIVRPSGAGSCDADRRSDDARRCADRFRG